MREYKDGEVDLSRSPTPPPVSSPVKSPTSPLKILQAGAKKLSPRSQRLQTTFDKKAQAQRDAASKKLREKKMREAAERRRRNAEFLARQKSGRA